MVKLNSNVNTMVGLASATGISLFLFDMYCFDLNTLPTCLGSAVIGALIPTLVKYMESEYFTIGVYISILLTSFLWLSFVNEEQISILKMILGLIGFVACCVICYFVVRYDVSNWLISLILFTFTFSLMTNNYYASWFGVAMFSSQCLNMLRDTKSFWLYPLKIDFSCGDVCITQTSIYIISAMFFFISLVVRLLDCNLFPVF